MYVLQYLPDNHCQGTKCGHQALFDGVPKFNIRTAKRKKWNLAASFYS
jgi:hypothetical protein